MVTNIPKQDAFNAKKPIKSVTKKSLNVIGVYENV